MFEKVNNIMSRVPNDVDRLTDWIWKIAFLLLLPWLLYLTNEQKNIAIHVQEDISDIKLEMEQAHSAIRLQIATDHFDTINRMGNIEKQIAVHIAKKHI